jgi:hypothetical protein
LHEEGEHGSLAPRGGIDAKALGLRPIEAITVQGG